MTTLTHHPECEFWFEYTNFDCTCGHSKPRPSWSSLEPWTKQAMDEWRATIRFKQEKIDAQ